MFSKVLAVFSLFALLGTQLTFAADSPASLPECSKIVSACKAQGYMHGSHQKNGKGLWVDCIGTIANGKTVSGVTGFTADDAKACEKAAKAQQQAQKAGKSTVAPAAK
jgi:hypothetical protein